MSRVDYEMSRYIHLSKYSKWLEDLNAREPNWLVTSDRLFSFWEDRIPELTFYEDWSMTCNSVIRQDVMPSMRTLMTAGKALARDNMAGFNCAAVAVNHPVVFAEIFHTLMNGTGVGFSVERQYINKLPDLPEELHESDTTIKVRDSKAGWAKGLKELIAMLYSGDIPKWDLSAVRPAGARLKTFGGRASGPEPLNDLFRYTVGMFKRAVKNDKVKLNSLECHDLVCKIADTVIVGSVRRSACISLSNLTDSRMAGAKRGQWLDTNPERRLANNSVAYTEKPDLSAFMKEMRNLLVSKSGERGIVNKVALRKKAESCGREHDGDYLLNPCGEAILRDNGGVCNLSEIVVRPDDTLEDLTRKAKAATILGTLQSTLTDFKFVRKVWINNQMEERLLGVSLTGIMDHPVLNGSEIFSAYQITLDAEEKLEYYDSLPKDFKEFSGKAKIGDVQRIRHLGIKDVLKHLKNVVRETNLKWSQLLNIPPSMQLTLVKPSGTVSQLVGCSPGMHTRMFDFYLRRVTQDVKDPLTDLMIAEGIPHHKQGDKVYFSFPIKAPKGARTSKDIDALEQLNLWYIYREYWCDGNPSQTVYYNEGNFLDIQAWLYKNWDIVGGLSFMPQDDNVYDANIMPYLEITEDEYKAALEAFPKDINWTRLPEFEKEDNTTSSQEYACVGNSCEL